MLLNFWVLKSSWTTIVQSLLSTGGPWTILLCLRSLCDRERPPALCWGHPANCVCAHVHPCSSWGHWEWCGGFNLLWSLRMKRGSSPGCCAALQAEPQPFWAPAHTKHRAVYDNRKRTVHLLCQVRPSSRAQTRERASDLGFLVSWWSIVHPLETASTTQPTTVLELLRERLGGILRKLEMLKSCLTLRAALQ